MNYEGTGARMRVAAWMMAGLFVSACNQSVPENRDALVAPRAESHSGASQSAGGLQPGMQPVALGGNCAAALDQLKQCHQKAVASGKGGPKRIEQSATYLRRLQAWWEMEPNNPALLASCQAMVGNGGMACEFSEPTEDAEDEAEFDAQFKMMMEQFDKAGVPR